MMDDVEPGELCIVCDTLPGPLCDICSGRMKPRIPKARTREKALRDAYRRSGLERNLVSGVARVKELLRKNLDT